ncbi:MAG: hypothetical protein P4K83_06315 [Terracidiphilus sp.]|nr:hypothetical protein [Terracidiphilus sp.]
MYSRTQNENGSYNTRCLDCFMTVASYVESEEELAEVEKHHICPERALAELLEMEKAHVAEEAQHQG